jgi:hypothetical protein
MMKLLAQRAATKNDEVFDRFRQLKSLDEDDQEDEVIFLGGILITWFGKKWLNSVAAENKRSQEVTKKGKKEHTSQGSGKGHDHGNCETCGKGLACVVWCRKCEPNEGLQVHSTASPILC